MNLMKNMLLMLVLLVSFEIKAQGNNVNDNPAYLLYNDAGERVSYSEMIAELTKADVVFVGEYHNSSLCHWLEYEIFAALADHHNNKVNLGMEMMEIDTQIKIDEYMADLISENRYLLETYLWPNYKMDYAPIVKEAKKRGVRLVSTNVPRRYAGALASKGIEVLRTFPEASQQYYIDVLPLVEAIKESNPMFVGAMAAMMGGKKPEMTPEHEAKMLRMTQAQALKDAVMAHSIAQNMEYPFIQINGAFHSDFKKGTAKFLAEMKPKAKIANITTVYQENVSTLEKKNTGRADFYIVLPNDTHKTY